MEKLLERLDSFFDRNKENKIVMALKITIVLLFCAIILSIIIAFYIGMAYIFQQIFPSDPNYDYEPPSRR